VRWKITVNDDNTFTVTGYFAPRSFSAQLPCNFYETQERPILFVVNKPESDDLLLQLLRTKCGNRDGKVDLEKVGWFIKRMTEED
jgi:hypothetical protein